jgi:hypothetical protein
MRESLSDLLIELANPNENGESRIVSKTEFVGNYSKLYFTNGCNWMRSLRGQYLYETYGRGNDWTIKLIGKDNGYSNRSIRPDIIKEIVSNACSHTGFSGTTQNGMECDHKNGRYDDLNALNTNTQTTEDFQPLCRQANLQKRSDCKSCKISGIRFNAKELGYRKSFIEGDLKYQGSCKGCYWEDCLRFKRNI